MSGKNSRFEVIDGGSIKDYPIDKDERLPELWFIKWFPARYLSSSAHLKCTYEVQGMALTLIFLATTQSPIGTLPDDMEELAALLRVPLAHFEALVAMGVRGPLRGWVRCQSEGEARLYHRVVLEQMQDLLARREQREVSRDALAENKRLQRVGSGLVKAGLTAGVVADQVLVSRIDNWLVENWTGNRTISAYIKAIEIARKLGWL